MASPMTRAPRPRGTRGTFLPESGLGAVDRADQIRQQIAEHRKQLAAGVSGERAVEHLREIRRLQAELDEIEGDADERE